MGKKQPSSDPTLVDIVKRETMDFPNRKVDALTKKLSQEGSPVYEADLLATVHDIVGGLSLGEALSYLQDLKNIPPTDDFQAYMVEAITEKYEGDPVIAGAIWAYMHSGGKAKLADFSDKGVPKEGELVGRFRDYFEHGLSVEECAEKWALTKQATVKIWKRYGWMPDSERVDPIQSSDRIKVPESGEYLRLPEK